MVPNKRSLLQAEGWSWVFVFNIVSNRCDHRPSGHLKLFRTSFHGDESLWCHTWVLYTLIGLFSVKHPIQEFVSNSSDAIDGLENKKRHRVPTEDQDPPESDRKPPPVSKIHHLGARRALMMFKDVRLRIRIAVSMYKVYGDSALLVLNRTALNSCKALLVLSWRIIRYFP